MTTQLQNKIRELHSQGLQSTYEILRALTAKPQVTTITTANRPLYQLELALLALLVPGVFAVDYLPTVKAMTTTQREVFVKNQLSQKFHDATEKENVLKLGLEIQSTKNLLEKLGSRLFDDPGFGQATEEQIVTSDGQSWFELYCEGQELPTPDEIRGAINE